MGSTALEAVQPEPWSYRNQTRVTIQKIVRWALHRLAPVLGHHRLKLFLEQVRELVRKQAYCSLPEELEQAHSSWACKVLADKALVGT